MIDRLTEMLKRHEGKRKKVYKCPSGYNTIGIGHNIDTKGLPRTIKKFLDENGYITDAMITELFAQDISDAISDCTRLYPSFNTFSENRKIALIDFIFNVGPGNATKFKVMNRAINAGAWELAAEALSQSLYWRQLGGDPKGTDDGKLERPEEVAKLLREG